MLKTDFQNDIQLHAVPLSRIKQFRDASQAEPMRNAHYQARHTNCRA